MSPKNSVIQRSKSLVISLVDLCIIPQQKFNSLTLPAYGRLVHSGHTFRIASVHVQWLSLEQVSHAADVSVTDGPYQRFDVIFGRNSPLDGHFCAHVSCNVCAHLWHEADETGLPGLLPRKNRRSAGRQSAFFLHPLSIASSLLLVVLPFEIKISQPILQCSRSPPAAFVMV